MTKHFQTNPSSPTFLINHPPLNCKTSSVDKIIEKQISENANVIRGQESLVSGNYIRA